MLFGLDGVEVGLIIVFVCLFAGILSGFPVAFAIGGAAMISFGILALLGDNGFLTREVIDTHAQAYKALIDQGVVAHEISIFRYPDLPTYVAPLFERGADGAFFRTLTFIVNRINERVLAGQSIETLLAVAMFVLMGIALERSRIAEDLLTTMARVFGALPGGLAVSVVVVGAFLAASTGIVGATVVTMGLLSLPTMLRRGYSPELSTGVIAASGTLGQIIPPSIVIVLLGTLAGDIYATAQEDRARAAGCSDALTYLGEAAVLSVGTLFKSAIVPGIMLAVMYGLYAFGYALLRPHKAPPIADLEGGTSIGQSVQWNLAWFLGVPAVLVFIAGSMFQMGIAGSQADFSGSTSEVREAGILRTNVSDQCKISMIELHGQDRWDKSVAARVASGNDGQKQVVVDQLNDVDFAQARVDFLGKAAPVSANILNALVLLLLCLTSGFAVCPQYDRRPLLIGGAGIVLTFLVDAFWVTPLMSAGTATLIYILPFCAIVYGVRHAFRRLAQIDLLRVVFPPLILIIAVLGSILGGITNPTPAAALGAGGAIMLAAFRKLTEADDPNKRIILMSSFAMVIYLLLGTNFDLRTGIQHISFENGVAIVLAVIAYHMVMIGFFFACWVLWKEKILRPVVRETTKVTAMVFAILIGSQMLNLVVISFGGEDYIQSFLRSFDREWVVFLIVMIVLFVLGFVLDFLEIIYIVVPIVGPVIYGGDLDPRWVTIMIAINLQTSFLTPPFGFALFYLRGVAPPQITTGHIYRGVVPFVIIQVLGLAALWAFPAISTYLPDLLSG